VYCGHFAFLYGKNKKELLISKQVTKFAAMVTREQLESYRQSYFPQLGDKPKTVEEKIIHLKEMLKAIGFTDNAINNVVVDNAFMSEEIFKI
jgi:hypothetical protein